LPLGGGVKFPTITLATIAASHEAEAMNDTCLTLRAALAQDRLEDFVVQQQRLGVEIGAGSDLERAVALLSVRGRWDSARRDVHFRPVGRRLSRAEIMT
jgi:hypothetical protein